MAARQYLRQKKMRMVWRVENNGSVSHLVGTAHFFPFSFSRSLKRLLRQKDTVLFEGPLDDHSSAQIAAHGRDGNGTPDFVNHLEPETIKKIDCMLRNQLHDQFGDSWMHWIVDRKPVYFESFVDGLRPFAAFFSLWQTCLNWQYSVDREGYQIAHQLKKEIHFLETLEEQLNVLDNISSEHIARYLNEFSLEDEFQKNYIQFYLDGDLENMVGLTRRFVTRGPAVIGARDQILFERMKPIFQRENALAFIGFPHVPGVRQLFENEGYTVSQECR
jgi:uncharacterized protein YbaP (TraB family)